MLSATTADISDSIAPSIAMVTAEENQRQNQVGVKLRNLQVRQAGGNSTEARSNGLHRKMQQRRRCGSSHEGDDVSGNALADARRDEE